MPSRAHASAVTCAANGVDLREPLKPAAPADFHTMTLPSRSVSATIVLLNDVLMCAWPTAMFLRALRRVRLAPRCDGGQGAMRVPRSFLERGGRARSPTSCAAPTVFFGPLRVRAFVFVRWPWTGSPRRWRSPR